MGAATGPVGREAAGGRAVVTALWVASVLAAVGYMLAVQLTVRGQIGF